MTTRRALFTCLALILLLDLVALGWGLPHTLAPQPDDIAKPTLDSIRHHFVGPSKYPKVHQLTLAVAYAPYLGWLWATGGLELGGQAVSEAGASALKDPAGSITTLLMIARSVNVLMHLGLVALVFRAARRLTGAAGPALGAAALFGLSPVLGLFARGTWVDVPMLFWLAAALLAWLAALEQPTRRRLLAYVVLATLAVCTKEQSAFALIPVTLQLVVAVLRRRGAGVMGGAVGDSPLSARLADLALAGGAGLLLFALLNDLLWAPQLFVARLRWWEGEMQTYRDIMGGAASVGRLADDTAYGFWFAGGPVLGACFVLALARLFVRPRRGGWFLLLPMAVYPLLLGAALGFMQPRYTFPMVLLGVLFLAHQLGVARAELAARPAALRALSVALGAAVALQAAHAAQVAWALADAPLAPAARWLDAHLADGTTVEIYQNEEELPGLRAVGLQPAASRDLTAEGLASRHPAAVVASNADHWRFDAAQRAFLDGLAAGAPGYEVARFGPAAGGRAPILVDTSSRVRLWPDVTVLVRRGRD